MPIRTLAALLASHSAKHRWSDVPLYYFELTWDGRELDEPLWFPDLKAAEREAREVAVEVVRRLGPRSINVSIRDQYKVIQKEIVVSGRTLASRD